MLFKLQAQMGSGYKSAFNDGQKSISSMREELGGLSEEGDNFGGSLSNAFGAIKSAIVASGVLVALNSIFGFLKDATGAAIEFESAMTGVAKTSDMDEKQLAAFSDEIKELATVIPVATTELGNIAEVAGQLGIADENLLEFTDIMAKLGTASTMTADEAATMLAQFANITQMDPKYYDNLGSVIVDLGNNYATTEQKITDMAQGIAAAGSLAGLSEADMMGLSAAVTSLGMETQAGSSAMSKLIAEMSAAAEKGGQLDSLASVIGKPVEEIQKALDNDKADKALKKFAKTAGMSADEFQKAWNKANEANDTLGIFAQTTGMSGDEFRKAWGSDATGTLTKFITGLNDTERNGKSATLVLEDLGITEVRMLRMILSLSKSGDLMNSAIATANDAWSENTALQTEAEKRYNTTESKLTLLNNAWNNLKITLGDGYTPALAGVVEEGAEFLIWIDKALKHELTLQDQLENVKDAYDEETSSIGAAGAVAYDYIGRLEELERQGLNTKDAQSEYHNILEQLVEVMPELNGLIDLETDKIKGGTAALRENTDEWMRNAVQKAYQDQLNEKTQAYVNAQIAAKTAQSELNKATAEYNKVVKQSGAEAMAAALGTTVSALANYTTDDWGAAATSLSGTENAGMLNEFMQYSDDLADASIKLEDAGKKYDDLNGQLLEAKDAIGDVALSMKDLSGIVNELIAEFGATPTQGGAADPALAEAQAQQNRQNRGATKFADPALAGLPGYASGLDYVPYDNFGARLHQGEQILTASEARDYRGSSGVQINYAPVINGGNTADIQALLRAHSEELLAQVGKAIDDRDADRARRSYR